MSEKTYLFQSRKEPERLFMAIAQDYQLAHFRAQAAIGPDVRTVGIVENLEMSTLMAGGKMEIPIEVPVL